jgi:hypothetical protein
MLEKPILHFNSLSEKEKTKNQQNPTGAVWPLGRRAVSKPIPHLNKLDD